MRARRGRRREGDAHGGRRRPRLQRPSWARSHELRARQRVSWDEERRAADEETSAEEWRLAALLEVLWLLLLLGGRLVLVGVGRGLCLEALDHGGGESGLDGGSEGARERGRPRRGWSLDLPPPSLQLRTGCVDRHCLTSTHTTLQPCATCASSSSVTKAPARAPSSRPSSSASPPRSEPRCARALPPAGPL